MPIATAAAKEHGAALMVLSCLFRSLRGPCRPTRKCEIDSLFYQLTLKNTVTTVALHTHTAGLCDTCPLLLSPW